jgi:hypothetical protein
MVEIVEFLQTPDALWLLLLAVLLFGVAPGLVLRLLLLVYPRSDPRRRELLAEMRAIPYFERPLFVGEQFETVLCEGVPHRARSLARAVQRSRKIASAAALLYLLSGTAGLIVSAQGVAASTGSATPAHNLTNVVVTFGLLGFAMLMRALHRWIRRSLKQASSV